MGSALVAAFFLLDNVEKMKANPFSESIKFKDFICIFQAGLIHDDPAAPAIRQVLSAVAKAQAVQKAYCWIFPRSLS